jgi:hypothetical protein
MRTLALGALAVLALLAIASSAGSGGAQRGGPAAKLRSGVWNKSRTSANKSQKLACGDLRRRIGETATRPRAASLHTSNLRIKGETIR